MTTPTNLPPSVAELRDIIAAHYRGDALNQLCALASRAEPAPVADEAAIEAWERDWDAATRTLHFRIQRDEFDGVRAMGARAVRLMRAAPRNDDGRLRKLLDLAKFVVDCDDFKKSPSDLLVVFDGRFVQDIRKLLAESPAGDAGESDENATLGNILDDIDEQSFGGASVPSGDWIYVSHLKEILAKHRLITANEDDLRFAVSGLRRECSRWLDRGVRKDGAINHMSKEIDILRETVSAQQQTIDSVIVACGSLGLLASELPAHIEGLRTRLQAAETERDLANETLESMTKERDKLAADLAAAKADRSIRDAEADGRRIQDLTAQLAAAQKERDEARSETAYLDNILEGIEHALGDRMKGEHSRAKARHIEALLADLAAAKADRDAFREKLDTHIEARQNCKHILVGESAVQAVERLAKERDWERHEWPKQIAAALHTEVGTIGATPSMVATAVQLEHEAHTRCLDRLVKAKNELAAAKAERKDGGA